jgi:hypothetical protein
MPVATALNGLDPHAHRELARERLIGGRRITFE